MTAPNLPEWIKHPGSEQPIDIADYVKLMDALAIAVAALQQIEQRKLEDLQRDKKKDEFHKTLMATAAWMFCGFTAKDALRRIEEMGK